MAQDWGSLLGKRKWPDMRSLRWPPEGAARAPADPAARPADGSAALPPGAVEPFELAPDPMGSGRMVAVPVTPPPRVVEVAESAPSPAAEAPPAADSAPPPEAAPAPDSPAAAMEGCQATLLLTEMRALRRAVEELTGAVRQLAAGGGTAKPATPAGPRTISDPQARMEIEDYFHRHPGETIYPNQLAEKLNLPVLKVAELCERIAIQGRIARLP